MNADGKNQRRRTRTPAHDWHPSWLPDGKRIVFVSHRDGNYEIYVMNADGVRQVHRLTKDGSDDTDPAWFDPAFAVDIAPCCSCSRRQKTHDVGLVQTGQPITAIIEEAAVAEVES